MFDLKKKRGERTSEWIRPPRGKIKASTDAAINKNMLALGVIFRNDVCSIEKIVAQPKCGLSIC